MYVNQLKVQVSTGDKAEEIAENFFVSKILNSDESNFQEINPDKRLEEKWEKILEEEKERIEDKVSEINPMLSEVSWKMLNNITIDKTASKGRISSGWIYDEPDESTMIFRMLNRSRRRSEEQDKRETNLIIISSDKESVNATIDYLENEINELESIVDEFIIFEELSQGSDILIDFLKNQTEDWKRVESEDDFEDEVQEFLSERTGIMMPNVEAKFESGESSEYDAIAMPLGQFGPRFAIEVKDFEKVESNIKQKKEETGLNTTLKNKLITQPKDQADMMGLSLIMIVNDLSGDTYQNLKGIANQRNVTLLNDEDYEGALDNLLTEETIKRAPTPHNLRSIHAYGR